MPIYEYACGKCEHEFEVSQRITDDPIKTCPKCRSRKVKKLISQTSFVLKGGGWYADAYSSTSDKSDSGSDADAKPSDEAKSSDDSKPDSSAKPEKKADKKADKKTAKKSSGKSKDAA